MDWPEFKQWVDDAATYITEGHVLDDPDALPVKSDSFENNSSSLKNVLPFVGPELREVCEIPQNIRKKLRAVWYTPLYVFAQAHPSSEWLTSHRTRK